MTDTALVYADWHSLGKAIGIARAEIDMMENAFRNHY